MTSYYAIFIPFNSKDTSQVIKDIFNALQKFPKYFNEMANSTLFLPELSEFYSGLTILPVPAGFGIVDSTLYVLPNILFLYWKDSRINYIII